jgi:hypothetical protein
MVQAAIAVRAIGVRKNKKKKVNTSGKLYISRKWGADPLNRVLSFLAHRVNSPTFLIMQNFISIGQGVTVGRGSKNRTFP